MQVGSLSYVLSDILPLLILVATLIDVHDRHGCRSWRRSSACYSWCWSRGLSGWRRSRHGTVASCSGARPGGPAGCAAAAPARLLRRGCDLLALDGGREIVVVAVVEDHERSGRCRRLSRGRLHRWARHAARLASLRRPSILQGARCTGPRARARRQLWLSRWRAAGCTRHFARVVDERARCAGPLVLARACFGRLWRCSRMLLLRTSEAAGGRKGFRTWRSGIEHVLRGGAKFRRVFMVSIVPKHGEAPALDSV